MTVYAMDMPNDSIDEMRNAMNPSIDFVHMVFWGAKHSVLFYICIEQYFFNIQETQIQQIYVIATTQQLKQAHFSVLVSWPIRRVQQRWQQQGQPRRLLLRTNLSGASRPWA
jgi:hypothetical protein